MHGPDDTLGDALLELISFINDPREDWRMMAEASLDLDPAFLPLLVRLGANGPANVVELAQQLGRDHSTVSRQLGRLETSGLARRQSSPEDGRVRTTRLTPEGERAVAALSAGRNRLLDRALAEWPADDRVVLSRLLGRFAKALKTATKPLP